MLLSSIARRRFKGGRTVITAAALLFLGAGASSAQGVKLEFHDGKVNLSAQNVPTRVILAEWARLGGTNIVGGDRVVGAPMTVELMGVTEREALDVLLREVPGYMLAARQTAGTGISHFDRIMIVPTTAVPRPAPAATFSPAPPAFAPNDAEDDFAAAQRAEQEAQRRAEELRVREEAARRAIDNVRGIVTPAVTAQPGIPPPFGEPAAPPPVTPPVPFPGNPFMPTPGSTTPGTIAPVPQQQQPQNTPRPVQ